MNDVLKAADAAEIVRLRAREGMLLGSRKPVIVQKYGPRAWDQLYGTITRAYTPAIVAAGLDQRCDDARREIERLHSVLAYEAHAVDWLDRTCVEIDRGIAARNK